MINIIRTLPEKSKLFVTTLGFILLVAVEIVDYLLGPGVSISIFFLIPIVLTAWFSGPASGFLIAGISAVSWLASELLRRGPQPETFIPYWNALIRFVLFVAVVLLLNELRQERTSARRDYLTKLGNRRHFFSLAEIEIKRLQRFKHPFTVAYIDIDNFKAVNDLHGHDRGDALLKLVAATIEGHIRDTDIAARLGGDEFAVLLPESGAEPSKFFFSELHRRLTTAVQQNNFPVTFSMGVMTFSKPVISVDEMVKKVDGLMYSAKESGKNLVKYGSFE